MNGGTADALARLLADLRSAIATVEQIAIDDLPGLVAARLLVAVEESRVTLMRARDAAIAAQPREENAGPLFQR